jgi:hypothetical protein
MVVVAKMVTVGPDTLNKIWQDWRISQGQPLGVWDRSYQRVSRDHTGKKFEDWLFSQGAMVFQENGRRYLRFLDAEQATFFLLQYA